MDRIVVGAKDGRSCGFVKDRALDRYRLLSKWLAMVWILVMALVVISPGVLALEYNKSIDVTIAYDLTYPEAAFGPYTLDEGQIVTLDLTVSSGFAQNFYFLTDSNYVLYRQDVNVAFIDELSEKSVMKLQASWVVEADGEYYLVIQNSLGPSMYSDSTIHGTMKAVYPSDTSWALIAGIGVAIAAAVIVVVVFLVVKKKPKGAAEQQTGVPVPVYAPPPAEMPPQQGAYAQTQAPAYSPPPTVAPPMTYYQPPAQAPPQARAAAMPSGPRVCRSCGRTVADASMRFCPNCGANMG